MSHEKHINGQVVCRVNMTIYKELDPTPENRIKFAFKGKHKKVLKVNIPKIGYPGQHIDVQIPSGSKDHTIVPNTLKLSFNVDVESAKEKTRNLVSNVERALVKKI